MARSLRLAALLCAGILVGAACGRAEVTVTSTGAGTAVVEAAAGGTADPTLAGVRSALARTAEALSGRMRGDITISGVPSVPGGEVSMSFTGAFDEAGDHVVELDMGDIAALAGDELPAGLGSMLTTMEVRTVDGVAYMRFPAITAMLGTGTEWIALPADEAMAGAGFGASSPSDPTALLESLAEMEDVTVEEIGREVVGGLDTTHYRLVFDLDGLAEMIPADERAELDALVGGLPELPMDVWIADAGVVARFSLLLDGGDIGGVAGETFGSLSMTYELFDIGADVDVEAPPADDVTDASAFEGLLEGLLGG